MAELVPDNWQPKEEDHGCCHTRRSQHKGPVNDILLWVECYASMAAVLAEKYPQKMSQLMKYQITIVRAHKSFGGSGWLIYDTSFRRKAASIKSFNWGEVDFTLYNETVVSSRPQAPMQGYSHELALYRRDSTGYRERGGHQTKQICQLYNSKFGNKCRFTPCKFSHICLECKGLHPLMSCRHTRPPPPKIPRTDSFRDYRDKKN